MDFLVFSEDLLGALTEEDILGAPPEAWGVVTQGCRRPSHGVLQQGRVSW